MSSIVPVPSPDPSTPEPFSLGGYAGQTGGIDGVGFWPRAGARVIDLVVHLFVSLCTGFFMGILVSVAAIATGQPPSLLITKMTATSFSAYVFAILGSLAYHTVCESVHGSTLGKLILSLVVIQEDGSPCRFKSALIRNLGYFVDSLFFGLIGYSAMKRTPQQQRYGDDWAHTIVCKRSQVAPDKLRSGGRFVLAFLLACMADSAILILDMTLRLTT